MKTLDHVKTLHELIAIAVADMHAAERAPDMAIDMGTWMSTHGDGVCYVCMAGAVMAGTLEVPRDYQGFRFHYPFSVFGGQPTRDKLRALSSLALRNARAALHTFYGREIEVPLAANIKIPPYGSDGFYPAIEQVRAALEAAGL